MIPNGLGTLYMKGPIYNVTTNGSFTSILPNGGVVFDVNNDIKLYSSHGSASVSTFNTQTYTTEQLKQRCGEWRESWQIMIQQYPKVEFNFVP